MGVEMFIAPIQYQGWWDDFGDRLQARSQRSSTCHRNGPINFVWRNMMHMVAYRITFFFKNLMIRSYDGMSWVHPHPPTQKASHGTSKPGAKTLGSSLRKMVS